MSDWIDGIGDEGDVPTRGDGSVPAPSVELSAEDYFLLSRVDGLSSIRQLFTLSPVNRDETIASLARLHDAGLIGLPNRPVGSGGNGASVDPTSESSGQHRTLDGPLPEPDWEPPYASFSPAAELLEMECALPVELRKLVLYYSDYMKTVTYYSALLVPRDVKQSDIRLSYYRLSKLFHPDRWFRQVLGPFEMPLRDVFAWVSKAHRTLSSRRRRAEYDALVQRGLVGPWQLVERGGTEPSRETVSTAGHSLARNALVARARRLRADGRLSDAIACFRKALKLGSDLKLSIELADTLRQRAKPSITSGRARIDLEEALSILRQVRKADPSNYAAKLLEARILKSMSPRDDAS